MGREMRVLSYSLRNVEREHDKKINGTWTNYKRLIELMAAK